MLNQSFSADNFRRILDLENRKGVYLEGRFFPNVSKIAENIKQCNKDIKEKGRSRSKHNDELKKLYEKRKESKEKKEELLNAELQKVSDNVVDSRFKIELERKDVPNKKPVYTIKDSPEHYFTMKQIQYNIFHLYHVKQSNRFEIVSQIKALLSDGFPKYVIRTDIDDFYENIPHKPLLQRINEDNLLTPFSRKILRQILNRYKDLSKSDKGIPRGVGVSAYLAELYMRRIDEDILSEIGISYYARYVDDIIIIFVPRPAEQNVNYLKKIKDIFEIKWGLKLSKDKTDKFDLMGTRQSCKLEYLGFKMVLEDKRTKKKPNAITVKTRLTDKKINKYQDRIDLAFNDYKNLSKVDKKKARELLVKRLRFLTGNTRLKNNKKNVLTGIYYSNSQLTEKDDLKKLDEDLIKKIDKEILGSRLQKRLKKYKFIDGFELKRFSPFKTHELAKIMKVWK